MDIQTGQQLNIRKLISFRKKVTAVELQGQVENLQFYTKSQGAKKIGGVISATYAVDGDIMDVEVYIPVDKEVISTDEFSYKPQLFLHNCVTITHAGSPHSLNISMQALNEYIMQQKLTPMSVGFVEIRSELANPNDLENFEARVYISVVPNIV